MILLTDHLPARAGLRDVTVEGEKLKEAFVELGRCEAGVVYLGSIGTTEQGAIDNLLVKMEHFGQGVRLNVTDDLGPIRMRLQSEQIEALKAKLLGSQPAIPGLPAKGEPETNN